MHYYLYEIRNNINGKIYIGVHKTKVLDDGYMGSGKVIKSAIEKHGIQNFTKTILEIFESQEEMFAREKEIVNEEFLLREDTYNLRRGGDGGWDYINKNLSEIDLEVRRNSGRNLPPEVRFLNGKKTGKKNAEKWLLDPNSKPLVFTPEFNKEMSKRAQTQEAKLKRSETRKRTHFQCGQKNSMYSRTWIWHELFGNKVIKKEFLVDYLDQGWFKTYKPKYVIPEIF